jgi:hypothetical protein
MLTQERLKQLLSYDPLTGDWHWIANLAGVLAGYIDSPNDPNKGYRRIWVDGNLYRSSRLAVLYMTGAWPPHLVDHENGKHDDDRWENLRPATHAQNTQNSKLRSTNTSGVKGLCFDKSKHKWRAQINCDGEHYHLGYFAIKEEAAITVAEASERLHGDFAHKESMLPARRLLATKREREFNDWCNRRSATARG